MNKMTETNPQTAPGVGSQVQQIQGAQPGQGGTHAQFVGSIPEIYDTHLGPLLFQFSGEDLARRVGEARPGDIRVLEVACGTGIATEHLWQALSPQSEIVATDLNPAMLDFAKNKRGVLQNVSYRQADVQDLPFGDGSFDAVVCQFGIMFVPDKAKAFAEMARVLRPGGLLAFNVWDALARNPVADLARETIAGFFETNPPDFLTVPFGYYEQEPIRGLIAGAGFSNLGIQTVSETVEISSATSIARGFVEGNPGILQIRERPGVDPEEIVTALAKAIETLYGPAPLQVPLREIVFLADKL